MKRTIAMILVLMLAMSAALMTTAFAAEEKIYCNPTLEDDFEDDSVIVMLTHEESMKLKDYTVEDFSEIGAVSIDNIKENTVKKIREQQAAVSSPDEWIDTSDFHQVLVIYLNTKSKQNVIDAIHKLEKREDIYVAQPNYIYRITDGKASNIITEDNSTTDDAAKKLTETTEDTIKNTSDNSNGAIPTGESNIAVFVLIITAITAAVWVYAAKRRSCK